MNKVEELLKESKINDVLGVAKLNELLKKEEQKKPSKAVIIFAVIGVIVAITAAAYGIYRFFTPDYLDDFEDDFDDEFEDDFFEDDDEEPVKAETSEKTSEE